jgi:hypothetical protein
MASGEPTAKVMIRTVDDSGEIDVETLWAIDLGEDVYELADSSFYAYSVLWEDKVYAPYDEDEKFPVLDRVVEKSGNRTVRVIFDPPVEDGNDSDIVLQGLVALGCSYEGRMPP